jgi:hypothetical protein
LFSPPLKSRRKELLHLHQIHRISPEFAGGSPEYAATELLHHLLHLFRAGDQGEGHPPSFFIFFPKYSMDELDSISSNAALRQQAALCSCSTHHR